MPRRVIVDENAGPGTEVWEQFQQVFGCGQSDCVFLAETHCGIPDVEILDKLLRPNDVLLTGDCVLHMRALDPGCRSYTLNDGGQLTRKQLPHVRITKPLPNSRFRQDCHLSSCRATYRFTIAAFVMNV